MDDNLIDYLLGVLDPATQARVEADLRQHPDLRERLDRLERALAPLAADKEPAAVPPGLVLSTLAHVAEHTRPTLPPAPPVRRLDPLGGAGRRWFRRADVLAAALVLILVGGLLAPWLTGAWHGAQVRACQNNLLTFWQALESYSDSHQERFPRVEPQGPCSIAGIVVPLLQDAGVLNSQASVSCPAQGRQPPPNVSVADLQDLWNRSSREEFQQQARQLAGHYAYTLGYREGETLHSLSRRCDGLTPIMADHRPGESLAANSPNHGGLGQNVLFIDGSIRWYTQPFAGAGGDHIYLNRNDQVSAGLCPEDTVLGSSDATPGP